MFTDLFCRAHIKCLNNNTTKLYYALEKLLRNSPIIVKILLFLGLRIYSKYLFNCDNVLRVILF